MASDNNSRQICKQAIIKLSLAISFPKMFFISQNLNHIHMTCSLVELLIFFWLIQVDIHCLKFLSHVITEILCLKTKSKGNQSWNKNKHFHLFLLWNKKNIFTCSLRIKLIILYEQSLFFLSFMNTFSEAAVHRVLKNRCS